MFRPMSNPHYTFPYLVLGETGVGKSSLFHKYLQNPFPEIHEPTMGVQYGSKTIFVEKKIVKLCIRSTGGSEAARKTVIPDYKDSLGVLLVYDITNRSSFKYLERWINQLRNYDCHTGYVTITLVANKTDLEAQREVTTSEGEEFAQKHGLSFVETSARDPRNVNRAFVWMARKICQDIRDGKILLKDSGKRPFNHLTIPPKRCVTKTKTGNFI